MLIYINIFCIVEKAFIGGCKRDCFLWSWVLRKHAPQVMGGGELFVDGKHEQVCTRNDVYKKMR